MPSTEASLSSGKYYLVADLFVTLITARPYYPDICIDVDLSAEEAATPIRSITFLVGNLSSHGARLHLLDKVPPATPLLQCCRSHAAVQELACSRPVMQHSLLFSGDSIFLDQSSESVGKAFSVQFEKEVFVSHDPSKHCKHYPTSEYRDYRVSATKLIFDGQL